MNQEKIFAIHISGTLKIVLTIKEMQTKTTMRYHYTSITKAKIKSCDNIIH